MTSLFYLTAIFISPDRSCLALVCTAQIRQRLLGRSSVVGRCCTTSLVPVQHCCVGRLLVVVCGVVWVGPMPSPLWGVAGCAGGTGGAGGAGVDDEHLHFDDKLVLSHCNISIP